MEICPEPIQTRHIPTPSQRCVTRGAHLYASALSAGRISRAEAESAPCLLEFALLHPDPDDPNWLRPVPPSVALAQRLHPIEREIQERRRHSIELTESFEPFMAISALNPALTHAITVLEGFNRINAALNLATAECHTEVLTIQPGGGRREHILSQALERDRPLIDRGVSMRTLYQHTVRHSQGTMAYVDRIASGKVEIRTLEELIERLIICDQHGRLHPGAATTSRSPWNCATPVWSATSSRSSSSSGAAPRRSPSRSRTSPPRTASPVSSAPSPSFSSRGTSTRPSPAASG